MADPTTDPVTFHAKVGTAGRIVIPEAERAAAGIETGDLVLVSVQKKTRADGAPEAPG